MSISTIPREKPKRLVKLSMLAGTAASGLADTKLRTDGSLRAWSTWPKGMLPNLVSTITISKASTPQAAQKPNKKPLMARNTLGFHWLAIWAAKANTNNGKAKLTKVMDFSSAREIASNWVTVESLNGPLCTVKARPKNRVQKMTAATSPLASAPNTLSGAAQRACLSMTP